MKPLNSPSIGHTKIIDVEFGKSVRIIEPCNLYGCVIGEESFIGPFVEIQSKVTIGRNCRVQSHSFICSLVTIGEDCFIGHGVNFTNDLFQSGTPSTDQAEWLPTLVENNVSIGSGSTILPVKIVTGCVIGAGSVVTKDLSIKGIYAGNPAKLIRKI
jgi:acetyltransferase-like isoleucine patch superfamily enzyme